MWDRPTHGPVAVPLANFTARIEIEKTRDNGINVERRLRIGGTLASGQLLPAASVAAAEFQSLRLLHKARCGLLIRMSSTDPEAAR